MFRTLFASILRESIIAITNKPTAKLHHVDSLYILTYDARKLKHKSISTLMYTVWHVDKYKITFKLIINHWTNEISVTDVCYTDVI